MSPTHASSSSRSVGLAEWRSEKIQPWHRDRWALVYVRQSTAQQVLKHQESARLQYGLVQRAEALGWAAERVRVIDDDQGESARHAETRAGFQQLVAEVSLDHVGIILGVEMSRLARSNKDWHQLLLELCALFRTLIADLDGIYDPAQYNDRLLLGLKGTMSEAELHILKQRMHQGVLSKARRGELRFALPIGYVWGAPGEIGFDPDEQVQTTVRLVFAKFAELGTLGGTLRYLAQHHVRLGVRVREGPGKGDLVWRRPNRATLQTILKHPLDAGAYVYGRRQSDPRRQRPGRPSTGRVVMDPADYLAYLPDRAPGYISPQQYEANVARLRANRARADELGAARAGAALLVGLVVCGRCGHRLGVHYDGDGGSYTYQCALRRSSYGEPLCQHLGGSCLDRFVGEQVRGALVPAALELSLTATERLQQERDDLTRLWQQRLERARQEAERAARQYHAVEPENRLVARTLERAWEEKLLAQQQLEEEYHRVESQQPRVLSAAERDAIRHLAADIPALWAAPTTTAADRKEIVRQVVERVVIDVQGRSERVRVDIHWLGGGHTEGEVARPVQCWEDLSYYPQLCARVRELADLGLPTVTIIERLAAEGYRPPRAGQRFGVNSVGAIVRRAGVRSYRPKQRRREGLAPDDWWPADLSAALGIPRNSLHYWIRRGWLRARQLETPLRQWVIWADDAEVARLRQCRSRSTAEEARQRWTNPPGPTAAIILGESPCRPTSRD